jgi:transcriptional regulator with GAF, ATPase, and Fis domain
MAALVRQARLVADTDTAVLIQGETGAGKEVLAQAIHEWSPRRTGPFVKLNCAAIPENLVEAELFGHTRGAFSGASQARAGRFLTANGGTLLLDEIGDLGLAAQAKLLRVLQEGTFEAVGSDRTTRVDVRVVAASHVDLAKAVAERRFREDLYYRLAVFPLRLPPLRERVEDLPALGAGVLADIRRRTGRGPWTLAPDAVGRLAAHAWPGNVRELVNVLERATILAEPGVLGARWFEGVGGRLPAHPLVSGALPHTAEAADLLPLEEVERRHVRAVLERCGGRIYGKCGAAEVLGLKPSTLQSLMQRLGVERTAKGAGA